MATTTTNNLQEIYLNALRKQKINVIVFLMTGVKLQGIITWFDNFCFLLQKGEDVQLVYKHAVSSIMPSAQVNLTIDNTDCV